MRLQFINHSSLKITHGDVVLLTDPWYQGSVFGNGWNLKAPFNEEQVARAFEGITHLAISHEHPDHFSPRTLSYAAKKLKTLPEVLVGTQVSEEVKEYFRRTGFLVRTISDGFHKLGQGLDGLEIAIRPTSGLDSIFVFKEGNSLIVDLNDAIPTTIPPEEIPAISWIQELGLPIRLASQQFSFAGYIGMPETEEFHSVKMKNKQTVIECLKKLRPKQYLATASFTDFVAPENTYLNKHGTCLKELVSEVQALGVDPIIPMPFSMVSEGTHSNQESITYWDELPLRPVPIERTHDMSEIQAAILDLQKKIRSKAGVTYWILWAFELILGYRAPIWISDLGIGVLASTLRPIRPVRGLTEEECVLSLHSSCLNYTLSNVYGPDGLLVSARFKPNANYPVQLETVLSKSFYFQFLFHQGLLLTGRFSFWKTLARRSLSEIKHSVLSHLRQFRTNRRNTLEAGRSA